MPKMCAYRLFELI